MTLDDIAAVAHQPEGKPQGAVALTHGAGDTLAAAVASALARGYPVVDAVAFAKSWVTECLRAAYPLGHGHGPVSPLFRLLESP